MAIPASSLHTSYTPTLARPSGGSSGLHHNVFQPPRTPGTPFYTTSALAPDQDTHVSNKRLRADSSTTLDGPSRRHTVTTGRDSWGGDGCRRAMSPPPLANARYSLAGGFDTPTLAAAALYEKSGYSEESDDFRRRWDSGADGTEHDYFGAEGALGREQNGRSRVAAGDYHDHAHSYGWGRFVFGLATSVATTVAGKMWTFCRGTAFRGFHAGDGRGYDFSQPTPLDPDDGCDGYFRSFTPVPGQFPRERAFSGDFEQDNTSARPSKRLHTDTAGGWLVVDSNLDTREASPRLTARKISNPSLSGGKPSASRASSRKSLIPVSRRQSSHVTHAGSPLHPQRSVEHASLMPVQQAQQHAERRASTASIRSPLTHSRNSSTTHRPAMANASPLTPEAQKFLAKKERQERLNDKSMRKMNKQLQDLIRQGNTALGTKYNVEGEIDDGAFAEGDADDWEDAGTDAMLGKW